MTSCGKQIPGDIIQPKAMEKVLYDYHLALSMSHNSKNTEKEAQRNYVFQKHGISEAEFDSSMVWYSRESKELMTIYENLNRRFQREYGHIERLLEAREEANTRTSVSGDTVNIWRKGEILWFNAAPLNKQLTFEISADTTFHPKDAFLWNMDCHFFAEGQLTVGMNVVYENDSVVGMTKTIGSSGSHDIYLHTDSAYQIKELNGFILVADNSDPKVLMHNIALTRYHMEESTDTLSAPTQEATEEVIEKRKLPTRAKSLQKTEQKIETIEMEEAEEPQSASEKRKPKNAQLQKSDSRK
jgi:hypothetical protein